MKTVYVYSAVPPNSKETIKEYGLLSGVEVAKNKEILKLARPTKKSREDFVKKVEATAASDRPYSVLGPSVLFTLPDESKITDKHFIKEWGLIPVRINLSKLVEDYPKTIIWGAELLPIKDKWRKLSDEAFDRKIKQEYGLTWEEFLEARSHELTLADARKYSKKSSKSLWKDYEKVHIGKMYAANVPHAFIITPMGNIPYEYIEFMDTRQNPRENSRVVPLPYTVIAEISSHIADSVNASLQSENAGEDLDFVYPISDLMYVDGSLIEDYPELVVHIYQVSHSNRDSIEDETGLVIELEPHEFLVTDVAGLDTGFLEDSDPVYILYLFLNTEVDPQFKFVDSQKVFHLLIHEWTHLQDRPFRKYYPQPTYKDYINQKHEVIAYAQQIINDVYIHRSEFDSQFRDSPNGIVEFLDAFSQEWNEIKGVLSRKNKNRILNYVYAELFMTPRENSRGIVVDPESVSNLVNEIRDYFWDNWNDLKHGGRNVILEDYMAHYVNAQGELISIPINITLTEYETGFSAVYNPVTEEIDITFETNSLPHFQQVFNPNVEHPMWQDIRYDLVTSLAHEITHALDSKEEIRRKRNVYDTGKYGIEESFFQRYANVPIEVSAFTNAILSEIYLSDTTYSNPEDAIFATDTWQTIYRSLSEKSKRLIKTRVFSRLFM